MTRNGRQDLWSIPSDADPVVPFLGDIIYKQHELLIQGMANCFSVELESTKELSEALGC